MRVVEPNQYKHQETAPREQKPQKDSKKRGLAIKRTVLLLLVIGAGLYAYSVLSSVESTDDTVQNQQQADPTTPSEPAQESSSQNDVEEEPVATGEYRQFSGNEFRLFYDNLLQPDLDPIGTPPEITGNDIADARIRQIAEQRGYKLRANPSLSLPTVQGYQLHEASHQPWLDMQADASSDGVSMTLVSAFRSVSDQRSIYLSRLSATGVSIDDVANGLADEQVDQVLVTSSIPGYSKHHTGYTLDLVCAEFAFENFGASPCFEWISANNYEKAKQYGFIPSYPDDADRQGPDPEAWEYVYVGRDLLTN